MFLQKGKSQNMGHPHFPLTPLIEHNISYLSYTDFQCICVDGCVCLSSENDNDLGPKISETFYKPRRATFLSV